MNKVNFFISIAFILVFIVPHTQGVAQSKGKKISSDNNDQWWVGFKGGLNRTNIAADGQFTVFSPVNTLDPNGLDKTYKNITNFGTQAGVIVSYEFIDNISVSLQPAAVNYKFGYTTQYSWADFSNTANTLDITMKHDHTLRYLEIPLIFRYDFTSLFSGSGGVGKAKPANKYASQSSIIIPYVQLGAFYGRLFSASKTIDISGVDNASGGISELEAIEQTENIDDLILKTHVGLIGGIGIGYNIGNARLTLEANYRYGFNNITNVKNRFTSFALTTGAFDTFDDMKIRNIEISVGILMPLKFITSGKYNVL